MEIKVLRKISPLDHGSTELIKSQDGFYGDGEYVDNDYPRDTVVAEDLVKATIGFALADEEGNIIKDDIEDLVTAEKLRDGATVSFGVEVSLPELEVAEKE